MSAYRVGQRVRVCKPGNQHHRKQGTITRIFISRGLRSSGRVLRGVTAHAVTLDDGTSRGREGLPLAFLAEHLRPLTDRGVKQFMRRLLQPVGCLDAPRLIAPAKRPKVRT